jgi:hypothetical protein
MLSLKVHTFAKATDGGHEVLSQISPYAVLSRQTEGGSIRVFIQGGAFYHEGGPAYKESELPPWLHEEIAKMTPKARAEVGLKDWVPPKAK